MTNTRYRIQLAFDILGFVVDKTEVTPFSAWNQGERGAAKLGVGTSGWSTGSEPVSHSATLDQHWTDIMARLSGRQSAVVDLSGPVTTVFTVLVGQDVRRPVLRFSREQIAFVASFNAEIDVG